MFENIPTLVQAAIVLALPLTGGALFVLVRHLAREYAHESAIARAKSELDKLAKTLAYGQISSENSLLSRKHLKDCSQIRRDFKELAKQRNLFCEQGASTQEWNNLATACSTRTQTLIDVVDLARDEIYWARLAKKAHRQAKQTLARFRSPQGNDAVDLSKAEKNLLRSQEYLGKRQYLKAWEHSRLVNPLIELSCEESKLSGLICSLDKGECSCPDEMQIIDSAKLNLDSARLPDLEHSELDNVRRRLKSSRIKLEKLAESKTDASPPVLHD